jgi:hypothetical protein
VAGVAPAGSGSDAIPCVRPGFGATIDGPLRSDRTPSAALARRDDAACARPPGLGDRAQLRIGGGGYSHLTVPRDCRFASKVVHICDVYDALRTHRPYREASPASRVLDYIRDRAGVEFDADLARSFIELMTQSDACISTTEET